jgi:hypothetical protein
MTGITKQIRERVRDRAGNRCEYCLCHQDYVFGQLQIDHVIPIAKGGTDTEDNLCLACELCNQHKWAKTEDIDPQTGKSVLLFNPRTQHWSQHFAWSEDGVKIIGLTACGRATINALKLNNELAVTVRRNWIRAGWHPPKLDS